MLRPGADDRRRVSAGSGGSPAGTGSRSPTPAASRCSRSTRRSTTTASRSARTYDGSMHRFTPEIAVAHAGAARRRHPDGARRVPAAAVAAGRWSRSPSSAPRRGRARARAAHRRDDQALFGIVQGGVDATLRGRERAAHRRARLRRLRHRRADRWARPATRCCRRSPPRSAHLPDRPAALPDGRRRSRRRSSRPSRSASTSSTA